MGASDSPQRARERDVLAALDDSRPRTVSELAEALDSHPVTVERHCQALHRAGRLRRCTGGTYALALPEPDPSGGVASD
ncbi:helix-turn-helix domain-containing protein [Halovalidus salilacus]|uniref:Lrp/AsnC family transcriptional regulator n=1 Tax=Halovalidus salilacus TaxID=3075124 RepID=UPI003615FDF8